MVGFRELSTVMCSDVAQVGLKCGRLTRSRSSSVLSGADLQGTMFERQQSASEESPSPSLFRTRFPDHPPNRAQTHCPQGGASLQRCEARPGVGGPCEARLDVQWRAWFVWGQVSVSHLVPRAEGFSKGCKQEGGGGGGGLSALSVLGQARLAHPSLLICTSSGKQENHQTNIFQPQFQSQAESVWWPR